MARRVVRRFAQKVLVNEHDGSRTQSTHLGGCGDSIPNLCKVPCSQCARKSRSVVKCFQCSSVVDLSRRPFGPKERRVCHEL